MFLKEKRDSSVKACMCADWHKQKDSTWYLGYLKGTLQMPLILSADSLMLSRWW